MRPQTLPGWHVLRNWFYVAYSIAEEHPCADFRISIASLAAVPMPCHDDLVNFWHDR